MTARAGALPAEPVSAARTPSGPSLRRLAVRGAGVTVLSQGAGFGIQLIASVILARLLQPSDFGLVAMVTTFSLLLMNCGLNGFTEAVIQRETIDENVLTNVFWINAAIGVALTLAFAAAGPLLARFYGDRRVAGVAVAVSVTILFTTLSVQHLALLKRAMRFSRVSANDVAARVISVVLSIALALAGWGYWALVAGTIAIPLSTAVGAWILCPWLPGLPRRGTDVRGMVAFATSTYSRFATNYCTWNLDNLLVGWRFGPQALGAYKKAYDFFVLPANQLSYPLTVVAVSALSRIAHDRAQYRRYFLGALSSMAFIGMAVGAVLTLTGRDLIFVLLGPKWEVTGRIFTFFGPGIGIMLLYGTHGWIHLSIGRADRWFRWSLFELLITAACFLAGLSWGPIGIAVAWVAAFWILVIPALWYAGRPVDLAITPMVGVVWRYVLASAVAGVACAFVLAGVPPLVHGAGVAGALVRIAVNTTVFTVFYVGTVIVLHSGLDPLQRIAQLLADMVPSLTLSRRTLAAPAPSADGV